MTSDWGVLRQLVERALERPESERVAYVTAECGDDHALRERVLALLAEDANTDEGRHVAPAGAQVFAAIEPATGAGSSDLPRRLGPWELRREIGKGGMGRVYLAVRVDGQFQRRVAIKLIKPGLDNDEVYARFQRERQVQANLDHPGIARMLDAGRDPDGMPYLVLEYIQGVRIDRYCDENRLSAAERIRLFCKVCDAVQHAHRNLVVHRDLKPNNILVTSDGEPKLLDFGIAKVLDPEKAAGPEVTQGTLRFMTPAYASPEQIRHRSVTTASDVYSLGVILYRLLTGHLPLDLATSTPAEVERLVCEVDPPKPSAVVTRTREVPGSSGASTTTHITPDIVSNQRLTTPRALARALSGELDSIVLMAMRKEVHRRYESVADLSQDLRSFLEGRPVKAQPDTALYRGAKFVRRNKLAVGAGMIVLASLVGGLVATRRAHRAESQQRVLAEERAERLAILAMELEEEKAVAEERAEQLRVIASDLEREKGVAKQRLDDVRSFATALIFDVAVRIVPLEGAGPAVELLCTLGVQFLGKLEADAGDDPEFLRTLAIANSRLAELAGRTHAGNGLRTALASHERSIELAARARDLAPDDPSNAYAQAVCLISLGRTMTAEWRLEDAERYLTEAVEVCAEGFGAVDAPVIGHLFCWWEAIDGLIECLEFQLRFDDALEYEDPARDVLDRLLDRWPTFPAVRSAEVQHYSRLARIESRRGDQQVALDHAQRAVDLQEALVGDRPNQEEARSLWNARLRLIGLYRDSTDLAERIELARDARRFFEAAVRADPDGLRARADVMRVLGTLAGLCLSAGQYIEAREVAAESVALGRRELERSPHLPTPRFLLVGALLQGGDAERELGRFTAARDLVTEARVVLESALTRDEQYHAAVQMVWRAYASLGRISVAVAEDPETGAEARRAAVEGAQEWLRKTLEALDQLEGHAALSGDEKAGREVARERLRRMEGLEMGGE